MRSAWFGQNDAPSLLLLVLAFALVSRRALRLGGREPRRRGAAEAVRARGAPFLALMIWKLGADRTELKRAGSSSPGCWRWAVLPFLIADPVAFYDDTVKYGAGTYRIVGYGLSAILVRIGIIADRDGAYPFALFALLTWVPLTVWLLMAQWRARSSGSEPPDSRSRSSG